MNAVVVAGLLLALGLVDGACSGFRSSVGRNGHLRHRPADRQAARRGAAVVAGLLIPAIGVALGAVARHHPDAGLFNQVGRSMLMIYLPYAAIVLLALAVYGLLGWRERYLAAVLVLGPLTLIRPIVVLVGFGAAVSSSCQPVVIGCAALATAAVLLVEPMAGRLWYDRQD